MQNADSLSDTGMMPAPTQADEPGFTRKRFKDFLTTHNVYELIPESGKVVLLDVELPVRQAFHALHEQGVAAASLWDAQTAQVAGIISASDFIHILRRLRNSVSSGANPMSEEEMDQHTIRGTALFHSGLLARSKIYKTTEKLCNITYKQTEWCMRLCTARCSYQAFPTKQTCLKQSMITLLIQGSHPGLSETCPA